MNLVSNPRRVRVLVLSLVALFFSFFVWHHRLDLMAIRIYNWQDIPQLILLICATYLTFAMQKKSLFSMYGVKLGLVESVGLVTMNTAGNLLLPARAGAISSAIYLKSAHKLEYGQFVGALAATGFVSVALNATLGILCLYKVNTSSEYTDMAILGLVGVVLSCLGFLLFLPNVSWAPRHPALSFFTRALNACSMLRAHPKILAFTTVTALTSSFFQLLVIRYCLNALGVACDNYQAMFIAVFAIFSSTINITPGNLGIRAAFAIVAAELVTVEAPYVVVASFLERLLILVLVIPLAWLCGRSFFAKARHDHKAYNSAHQ